MIALIFCGDLKYCPYATRYIERFKALKVDYKVYFWNRGGYDLKLPDNYIYLEATSALTKSKFGKLFDFIKFRYWLLKKIEEDNPDKIVALSTLTGIILGRKLYLGKRPYIFDIRDYSYENIKPVYAIEKQLIENSMFTAISSKGFQSFLPKHDYVIAHNFNRGEIVEKFSMCKTHNKIKFVWNGVIRYFEYQKQYLDALKNDNRFEIVFHGDGPDLELYKKYCLENKFLNVTFTGAYDNREKKGLLSDASILNNCYGYLSNAGDKIKHSVSNRYYDGIVYHIPQLVEPEGYKAELVRTNRVGISIAADENFADNLYDYYQSIQEQEFDKCCDRTLDTIISEDNIYIDCINKFASI